jgi:superfamily I DNA/RNA helicase
VKLTKQQRDVVDAEGNFFLLACPGSGKTRSAAERVARLTGTPGMKIGVCSYTNVGADRLSTVIRDDLRVILGPEHFIGTVHGFLIRYVLTPFGNLIGNAPPVVIRSDNDWGDVAVDRRNPGQRVKLSDFRHALDGSLILRKIPLGYKGTAADIVASVGDRIKKWKVDIYKKHGLLTADDAMWASLCLLRARPDIARAVAGRFDELLLDEAQDTSALQLECVKLLKQSGGLRSLVLVGDLAQSIYSFQGASAAGCRDFAAECGLEEIPMDENHRCSQNICDIAAHFCEDRLADRAVGPDKDCKIMPEVVIYPHGDPAAAVETFRQRLQIHGIPPYASAVLARRTKVVEAINGDVIPDGLRDTHASIGMLAAAARSGTLTRYHVATAQRLVAASAWGLLPDELDDEQRARARAAAHALLLKLPIVEGNLKDFVVTARDNLSEVVGTVIDGKPAKTAPQLLPTTAKLASHDAAAVFSPPSHDLTARTVHSFKGEDSDAVLVVVRKFHHADPTEQMQLFRSVATGSALAPEKEEERRVMFVALTRARRYCLVALPSDRDGMEIADHCVDLGFVRIN